MRPLIKRVVNVPRSIIASVSCCFTAKSDERERVSSPSKRASIEKSQETGTAPVESKTPVLSSQLPEVSPPQLSVPGGELEQPKATPPSPVAPAIENARAPKSLPAELPIEVPQPPSTAPDAGPTEALKTPEPRAPKPRAPESTPQVAATTPPVPAPQILRPASTPPNEDLKETSKPPEPPSEPAPEPVKAPAPRAPTLPVPAARPVEIPQSTTDRLSKPPGPPSVPAPEPAKVPAPTSPALPVLAAQPVEVHQSATAPLSEDTSELSKPPQPAKAASPTSPLPPPRQDDVPPSATSPSGIVAEPVKVPESLSAPAPEPTTEPQPPVTPQPDVEAPRPTPAPLDDRPVEPIKAPGLEAPSVPAPDPTEASQPAVAAVPVPAPEPVKVPQPATTQPGEGAPIKSTEPPLAPALERVPSPASVGGSSRSRKQIAAERYLRDTPHEAIPMTSNGELQKFTNIRSVAQVHGKGVTILFDGYTSTGKVPPSILLRGEKCDKDTHQVYWYFKPSPTGPNTYSIVQANTGLILTYPKRPIPGSQLTVEETSDSVWEVRKGHGHWIITPHSTLLALTVSKDTLHIVLQYASDRNEYQQWWCPKAKH